MKIPIPKNLDTSEGFRYGSKNCRDEKHWENILAEGECRTCGLKEPKGKGEMIDNEIKREKEEKAEQDNADWEDNNAVKTGI